LENVWVVVDGSTDGSHDGLLAAARPRPGLRVIVRERRGGKGAAVLTGPPRAGRGPNPALVMDADCQHPAGRIGAFMEASMRSPGTLVCGRRVFGPDAPWIRLAGRRLSAWLARAETLGRGARTRRFGLSGLSAHRAGGGPRLDERRGGYDFDPEVAVRLAWSGVRPPTLMRRAST